MSNHFPGRIWIDGLGLGWGEIGVRGYRVEPGSAALTMREHALVLYLQGHAHVRQRYADHEEVVEVGPGDLSVHNHAAACEWSWDGSLDVLHIYVEPALIERVAAAMYGHTRGGGRLRNVLKVRDETIQSIGGSLVREVNSALPGARLLAHAMAEQLAVQLVRHHYAHADTASIATQLDPHRRRKIQEFAVEHIADDLSLPTLAGSIGLGAHHFARLFRNTFGTSPHRYIMDLRLERARVLLRDPRRSIGEIAQMTGFADQSHLTRRFKERHGLSPRRWRAARAAGS